MALQPGCPPRHGEALQRASDIGFNMVLSCMSPSLRPGVHECKAVFQRAQAFPGRAEECDLGSSGAYTDRAGAFGLLAASKFDALTVQLLSCPSGQRSLDSAGDQARAAPSARSRPRSIWAKLFDLGNSSVTLTDVTLVQTVFPGLGARPPQIDPSVLLFLFSPSEHALVILWPEILIYRVSMKSWLFCPLVLRLAPQHPPSPHLRPPHPAP